MAAAHTWAAVRPKVEAEIDEIKAALLDAEPDKIVRLQERARALIRLQAWFEADAEDERKLTDDVSY